MVSSLYTEEYRLREENIIPQERVSQWQRHLVPVKQNEKGHDKYIYSRKLITVRRTDSCKIHLLIRERIVNATKEGVG